MLSQYNTAGKKVRGKRFTLQDKILAVSIYKSSPKCYCLLRKIFSMPSERILRRLLMNIPFSPGVNEQIFDHLRKVVGTLCEKDKYCTIIFDKISLQPSLYYDRNKNYIEGFHYFEGDRVCKFADHALVFMAQGIYRKWKQPLAFMFCEGSTSTQQLASLIKRIAENIISCGLVPVSTVCVQGNANKSAKKKHTCQFRQI